jgi:hypothetical protein
MPTIELEVSSFDLAVRNPRLSVTVSIAVSIDFPADMPYGVSLQDIVEMVQRGNILVTRAAFCHLRALVEAEQIQEWNIDAVSTARRSFMEAITQYPVHCSRSGDTAYAKVLYRLGAT